ncbi:hypothetical protein MOMA_01725 [Moraxella macacae 0408225]|uniref:Uncharacterized protein n=1 Tax=Moraxella macacae 0408225 TaxID=1230338 RepID=L2F8M2_9GAMM|nr:hypothetical protein [Moraxella macacae]ELA09086.1 hypothetical protein MOMA_01725 [Moraxella macacae 0408225]
MIDNDEQQNQSNKNSKSLQEQFDQAFDRQNLSDKEKDELEKVLAKIREKIGDEVENAKLKVRVVNMNQVQNMYKRLGRASNFYYIGAVLCLVVALYFVQQGKQILPGLFGLIMLFNVAMSLYSYRAIVRIERFMKIVRQQTKRKFKQ